MPLNWWKFRAGAPRAHLDYDFSDHAVRQALIQTAERLAQEFAGGEDEKEEH